MSDLEKVDQMSLSTTVESYVNILEKRFNGVEGRTIGFDSIDQFITIPGREGDITILAGDSGSGKSLMALAMEIELLRKNVCVAKLSLEMSSERNSDRLFSMLLGKDSKEFIDIENQRGKFKNLKDSVIQYDSLLKRYYFNDDSNLSLYSLPTEIEKIKAKFISDGVLPKDGYFVLFIDLLSLLDGWGQSQIEIQASMDSLHRIIKKSSIHLIGIVQTNENEQRSVKNKSVGEKLYHIGLHNIKASSVYKERARDVLLLNRPKLVKARNNGISIQSIIEEDIMRVQVAKSNDGKDGYADFIFSTSNGLSIVPKINQRPSFNSMAS
ncbi:DnaB-like helicase C-terminal domain-containing protein [Leptospira interrogans]|uniref:DnaB-like helicase C-terminal domain-containing protein n=1 Tax=Leptospira interrogans TaxID=173 RepID=UPI0002980AFB|nr:DnaB-like helicase C-terminal domain-containing protein [Leptospira interrogans]EKR15294.1 DnaB-like helicase C-terminal domain protein [Leptospira interrogans serovar Pyrogenes str. 2006006960]UML82779.1 DnaB helicase C-terminal domain-containing protein [Leptospira interrogans]